MRVASPFNDCTSSTLKLYKVIDPNMWGKMISRVNGVSFTGMYGGTTAMGWKSIKKPKNFTWEQYLNFLLSTLDDRIRYNYESRFATSIKFWKEKGGVLDDKVIKKLEELSIDFKNKGKISKVSDKNSVVFETYPDDVEINTFKDVPSFKRMYICILKNDWYCKYMGFTPTKKSNPKEKQHLRNIKICSLLKIKNWKMRNKNFKNPVYDIKRVPVEKIQANSYNPNIIATSELKLLYKSILEDGYTLLLYY